MPSRRDHSRPALITSARPSRSLDNGQRRVRYLWTMGVRVVCFLAATVTPLPWNALLLVAAAVLPTVAVMLANAVDQRQPVVPAEPEGPSRPALGSAETVPGTVVDHTP